MAATFDATRRTFLAGGAASVAASSGRGSAAQPVPNGSYSLAPGLIYLNTASLGPTPKVVHERIVQAWRELEADPVRMAYSHTGNTVVQAADEVRGKAAKLLGCAADEVLISTGTTNGMTLLAQGLILNNGDRVLTTDQEHEGGSVCWDHLARRRGVRIDRVPIAPGDYDTDDILARFAAAITPATRVISVSHVITSNGLRMPIAGISALARAHGILCVVDGAQAVGGIDVDVKALGCHAYATSGHKWLMGPKGTGLLYISRDAGDAIAPVQWELDRAYGSNSAGVGPMANAIGLGVAIDLLLARGAPAVERHIIGLRNQAYAGLKRIPGLRVVSPPPGPLATQLVAAILPDRIDSLALRQKLHDQYGIVIKMAEKRWFNGIRLSPHVFNTEADIDAALRALSIELA